MNGEIFAFIVYFVAIVGVGIYFFFKEKGDATQANFFLGGRQMGPWVAAMSAQASDMSAWLLMGLPGSILAFGFGQMWIGIGLALGTAANWIFVAKRLRKFSSAAGDAITVPQYLGNRFLSKSNALHVICGYLPVAELACGHDHLRTGNVADHILWRIQSGLLDRLFPGYTDVCCADDSADRDRHHKRYGSCSTFCSLQLQRCS